MALKNSLSETSPMGQLITLGFLMVLGVGVALLVLFAFNFTFFHLPLTHINIGDLRQNPASIMAAKMIQIASQFGLFILPAIALAYLTSNNLKKGLSISTPINIKVAVLAVISTLLAIPFINLLAQWNTSWHLPSFLENTENWMRSKQAASDQLMELILVMDSPFEISINILMMAILPAIGEELLFRGAIQKILIGWLKNPHIAILVTAIFFSAFHMQFLGFFSRMLLGMLFGYLFYYSKNIWTAIFAHFTNNMLALVLAIVYGAEMSEESFENPYSPLLIAFSISTFMTSGFLIWVYQKKQPIAIDIN